MDEVELVFVATNYLKELGYTIDESNVLVKDKIVTFKNVKMKKLDNDSRTNIVVSDIDVFIDNSLVLIMETSSSFLYNNMRDFYKEESSRLSEKMISTKYSFTMHDGRVIKSCNRKIVNLYHGNIIDQVNNNYTKTIEVDNNYQLTDGFPYKNKDKKLIKE